MINPVVGLRLAHPELQAVHLLNRIGLLVDQDEEQPIFKIIEQAFGATAGAPLTRLTFERLIARVLLFVGRFEGRQQVLKFFYRQTCRREKSDGVLFQLLVAQHTLIITYSRYCLLDADPFHDTKRFRLKAGLRTDFPQEIYETNVRNYESIVDDGAGARPCGERRIGPTAADAERRGDQGQDARQQGS